MILPQKSSKLLTCFSSLLLFKGKSNCPYYAKAELLGDQLAKNLPDFRVHKIVKDPSEWDVSSPLNDWTGTIEFVSIKHFMPLGMAERHLQTKQLEAYKVADNLERIGRQRWKRNAPRRRQ